MSKNTQSSGNWYSVLVANPTVTNHPRMSPLRVDRRRKRVTIYSFWVYLPVD